MEQTITTPRLKLTLMTAAAADRDSEEFKQYHELHSNAESSFWSLYGPSKSEEDTAASLSRMIPTPHVEDEEKAWKMGYAVHEFLSPSQTGKDDAPTRFIGRITVRSLRAEETTEPPRAGHASTATRLSLELSYMYLPTAWGKGYATESISAVLAACGRCPADYWGGYESVIVRAIVSDENIPSQRVMEKCGMGEPGVLEFEGGTFFIAGKWRSQHRLFVYEKNVVG